ncbi:hypothetical protein CASFOL_005001 [Castilleja foliolosa]|uniref:Secreted protein n=1 Tax=Castilleja foliolosa TaxID=1961234 RepID=A0ABD3E258_9LAMI
MEVFFFRIFKFITCLVGIVMACQLNEILQSLDQDARKEQTPVKLRAKAAKFAKSTVKNQMAAFKVIFYFYQPKTRYSVLTRPAGEERVDEYSEEYS